MSIFNKFKKKRKEGSGNPVVNAGQLTADKTEATAEPEYEVVEKEILPEKMICPDCGGITLVGLDFCDKCGGELINQDS